MAGRLTFVLGGVRAGKSAFAQKLASKGGRVIFVATAQAGDAEMKARIEAHRKARPASWNTLEEPLDPVSALRAVCSRYDTVLFDCMTLWVSNLLIAQDGPDRAGRQIGDHLAALLELRLCMDANWVVVSNEVGLGVIPPTELGRRFSDELGRVNQALAQEADEVYLMVAGLPVRLKPAPS